MKLLLPWKMLSQYGRIEWYRFAIDYDRFTSNIERHSWLGFIHVYTIWGCGVQWYEKIGMALTLVDAMKKADKWLERQGYIPLSKEQWEKMAVLL